MRSRLVAFGLYLSMVMIGGDLFAQEQRGATGGTRGATASTGGSGPPIEFSNNNTNGDLNAPLPPGGGPLGIDPEQILYTEAPDSPGSPFPHDSRDMGVAYQIDALAKILDAYFNAGHLAVSFRGDDAPYGHAVFVEDCIGIPGLLWTQRDLYAENANPPIGQPITDVDALELWGPRSNGSDPLSGWDANLFSLEGDPAAHGAAVPTSVYYHNGSTVVPFITRADIFAAVSSLGFAGTEADVDLDGLMAYTGTSWSSGGRIIFSIRAAANWDGGEIVYYTKGGAVTFLSHGGHLWDTAFDVAGTFHLNTEDVDAIEGLPCPGWPDGGEKPPWKPSNFNNLNATNHNSLPAFDLHVVLHGLQKINDHLDGGFGNFTATRNVANNTTTLEWSAPPPGGVAPGATVQVCWFYWGHVAVKDMYWTYANGSRMPVSIIKPEPKPHDITDPGPTHPGGSKPYDIKLIHTYVPEGWPPETIRVRNLRYALFSEKIEMPDLGDHNPVLMDALVPFGESYDIPPGEGVTVPIPVPVPHGKWVAVVYDVAGEDHVVHATEYGETIALEATQDIPAVSTWGMVVMVILVLAAGTVVIRRARALPAHG